MNHCEWMTFIAVFAGGGATGMFFAWRGERKARHEAIRMYPYAHYKGIDMPAPHWMPPDKPKPKDNSGNN